VSGRVIPREGVESFLNGNETSLQVTLVIPREGVESPDARVDNQVWQFWIVIPREGVESSPNCKGSEFGVKGDPERGS